MPNDGLVFDKYAQARITLFPPEMRATRAKGLVIARVRVANFNFLPTQQILVHPLTPGINGGSGFLDLATNSWCLFANALEQRLNQSFTLLVA